jgi:hypothetical protein
MIKTHKNAIVSDTVPYTADKVVFFVKKKINSVAKTEREMATQR